jgi:hypothetical protein
MLGPYTLEKLENWVSDFSLSEGLRPFSAGLREAAAPVLVELMKAACAVRESEPEDIEEPDVKAALVEKLSRLSIQEAVRLEVPALCAAFLSDLEAQGRLGGGRMLGAYAKALAPAYLEKASGKTKPITRPGSKIGRNEPCPCGSGRKYKKCCMGK